MNRWPLLLSLGAWAACAPANPDASAEVAAELRALRQVLVAATPSGVQAPAARPATSATDIANALAPLRQALERLAGNQQELQQRQLALTQELTQWSRLLVDNTASARRDEGDALLVRLQQLEASLQAQDARHREVEALMQGALEHTADRLGEFLLRVGADLEPVPPTTEPRPATETPEPEPARGAVVPAPPAETAPTGEGRSARWDRRGAAAWWWGGVAGLATLVGVFCLLRWRHLGPSPRPAGQRDGRGGAAATLPAGDPDVQEIWAAAALLGEAVGRLRDSTTATTPESGPPADEEPGDDLIVIDDDLLSPASAAPTDGAPSLRTAPAVATCLLRTEDPARSMESVLQILQEDPRVLRRPEPAVRCSRDCLEVSFRLVPELPPGERSHLEQRLRDACSHGA